MISISSPEGDWTPGDISAPAIEGIGEHGYFGDSGQHDITHGEAEDVDLADYIDSSVNTINAPDFVAQFNQNGSNNTLFGNLDEGRVAWVNGNDQSRSTSFEPNDGVESYLSAQVELKGPSSILFDDLGITDNSDQALETPDLELFHDDSVDASDL